jgi:glyoxylase-like metal-dependent hydrolase (beta-lactamase superfamily II)
VSGAIEAGSWHVEPLRFGALEMDPGELGPPGAYPGPVQTPVYGFLLRGHGETVLVDAGSGPFDPLWRGAAGLPAALAAAGVEPSAVTRLALTHLDFDHAGGAVAGEPGGALEPAFAGVPVALSDEALEWWRARTDENAGTPILAALERAGVAAPVADGAEVLPGVVLRSAPGHRPGHACLEIGGRDGLVLGADLVHDPAHVPHPEWEGAHDFDRDVALATRLAWFGVLADGRRRVHFSHVDGFGIVERDGDGFRWSPM